MDARFRPLLMVALAGACALAAPPATAGAPAPRAAKLTGKGPKGSAFSATAKRTTMTKWCATIIVRQFVNPVGRVRYIWGPERDCGTIRGEDVVAVAFGCPYVIAGAAIIEGSPQKLYVRYADGSTDPIKKTPIRDRSARGTFYALTVPDSMLPAKIIRVDRGKQSTVTTLAALKGICYA